MSSKFESTLAELYKLKNQIRIELNQIRPNADISIRHQNPVKVSQKKRFVPTDLHSNTTLHPKSSQPKV
jgi:hypothetical protein